MRKYIRSRRQTNVALNAAVLLLLNFAVYISQSKANQQIEGCTNAEICESEKQAECMLNGERTLIEYPTFEKREVHPSRHYFVLNDQKQVIYIPNFLNETEIVELKGFCIDQKRFVPSPQRSDNEEKIQSDKHRTSESCAMVPTEAYMKNPRFNQMMQQRHDNPQMEAVMREVELTHGISERAKSLLHSLDSNDDDDKSKSYEVEPLQMVRYLHPKAHYQLHHDHGGFYGNHLEHRPFTILVFLNNVPFEAGGMTSFPKLNLKVSPKRGDAILWSNVDKKDGAVDADMVHAGEPPSIEGIQKYALNIWIQNKPLLEDKESIQGGAWGTQ